MGICPLVLNRVHLKVMSNRFVPHKGSLRSAYDHWLCNRLGICGTQVKSSIQGIVDEVAPKKIKSPPMGLRRTDSFECDIRRLIRGAFDSISGIKLPKNSHLDESCVFFHPHGWFFLECHESPACRTCWIQVSLSCKECSLLVVVCFGLVNTRLFSQFVQLSACTMLQSQLTSKVSTGVFPSLPFSELWGYYVDIHLVHLVLTNVILRMMF